MKLFNECTLFGVGSILEGLYCPPMGDELDKIVIFYPYLAPNGRLKQNFDSFLWRIEDKYQTDDVFYCLALYHYSLLHRLFIRRDD